MAENIAKITFLGIDKVTGVAKDVTRSVGFSLASLGSAGKGIMTAFTNLNSSIGDFTTRLRNLALIGLGVGAGVFALAKGYGALGESLEIASARTGLTLQQFQLLSGAAKQNRVSTDEFTTALSFLNKAKALALKNPESEQALAFLGAGLDATALKTKSVNDIFLSLSDAFSKSSDTANKTLISTLTLGRASGDLFAFLNKGRKEIEKDIEAVKKYGFVLSDVAVKDAAELDKSFDNLSTAVEGFRNVVAFNLLPIIKPMLDSFNNWFAANKKIIGLQISQFVKEVSLQFKGLWGALKNVAGVVWPVIAALGGLKTLFYGFIGLKLAGLVVSLVEVGTAIYGIGKAIAVAGFALFTNPIGLLIVAIAALGIAIYAIYTHWDTLKAKFLQIWPPMQARFELFANALTLGVYGLVKAIIVNWDSISAAWNTTMTALNTSWDIFSNYVLNNNSFLSNSIKSVWDYLKSYFVNFWQSLIPDFEAFLNTITLGIYGTVKSINGLLGNKSVAPVTPDLTPLKSAGKVVPISNTATAESALATNTIAPATQLANTLTPEQTQQLVRLYVNLKIDSDGRPNQIKSSSNVPLDFEANTGVLI